MSREDTFWSILKNPGSNGWKGEHHLHTMPEGGVLIAWWETSPTQPLHLKFVKDEGEAKAIVATCLERGSMCRVFATVELFRCVGENRVWRITDRLKKAVQGLLTLQEKQQTLTTKPRGDEGNKETPAQALAGLIAEGDNDSEARG